ncbi:Uma2 family endonuclease [Promineifilum sp.]|uniref:Uma2 family endonuclease n=1 Tax=Promineifilum sp. TaxID=2664178 RepID=UPI0035AD9A9C
MTIADAAEIVAELERLLPDWIDLEPARWQRVEYALRRAEGAGPVFPTFESFIEWVDEDTSAEWVEGEVYFMSPASTEHQDIVGFLAAVLRFFVERKRLGRVLIAPYRIKLPGYAPEPDIMFLAAEHVGRLHQTYLDGPADLIIEIVSPESVERDRIKKYNAYEAAGVGEFWLIDPAHQSAEFYQLKGSRYELAGVTDGIYESQQLPGFRLPVAWFWREPLPMLDEALQSLGLL